MNAYKILRNKIPADNSRAAELLTRCDCRSRVFSEMQGPSSPGRPLPGNKGGGKSGGGRQGAGNGGTGIPEDVGEGQEGGQRAFQGGRGQNPRAGFWKASPQTA